MPCQPKRFKLIPVAVLLLHATGVFAEEPLRSEAFLNDAGAPMFSFSGFGTLGVVHSSERNADFTASSFKSNGAGHSRAWSADVDSLLAGQVVADFTSKFSATLQVISNQNYDSSYRPHVEWANIKYQFTPDFSVRAGRTVLPGFLISESRNVGYTYAWVRPPLETYGLDPLTSADGLDASYRLRIGELTSTVQANAGRKTSRSRQGAVDAGNMQGMSLTTEYGALTMRVAYQKATLTVASVNPLFDGFRQFGPQGVAIADRYGADHKPISFVAVGVSYDPGNWFAMAEWGSVNTHSVFGKLTGWYASSGYRLGKFTPFVTYARATADNLSDPGLNAAALPPFLAGPATGLNTSLNAILSAKIVRNTFSIGGRWDFMKNTAFKLQFEHTRVGAGSSGGFINTQPGFQTGGQANIVSATIDFVF